MKLFHDVPVVYLHREPVDFRKAINGLVLIIEHEMAQTHKARFTPHKHPLPHARI